MREEREERDEGKEKIEDGRDMSYGVGLTLALNISFLTLFYIFNGIS